MKKQSVTHIISLFTLITMVFNGFINSTVVRANTPKPTIDFTKKGSISIFKKANGIDPINKVEFSGVKIADIMQTTNGTIGINYQLTEVGKEIFTSLANKDLLTAAQLNTALKEDVLNIDLSKYDISEVTDINGIAKFTDLDLGVYIIEETDSSNAELADGSKIAIVKGAAPFLVLVPETSKKGDSWEYDREIVAKNIVAEEIFDKSVTGEHIIEAENGELTVAIGSAVEYMLTASISRVTEESIYVSYKISDNINEGIDYGKKGDTLEEIIKGIVVKIGDNTLVKDVDYQVDMHTTDGIRFDSFDIIFIESGLNMLNNEALKLDGTGATEVKVTYLATINKNAVIAGANNEADLYFKHKGGEESNKGDKENLIPLTFEIEKHFDNIKVEDLEEDTNVDATNVTFAIKYKNNDVYKDIYVKPIENKAGYYIADFSVESNSNGYSRVFACNKEGKVMIFGLPKGAYIITELTTDNGYTLLVNDVEVILDVNTVDFRDAEGRDTEELILEQSSNTHTVEEFKSTIDIMADTNDMLIDNNTGTVIINNEKSPAFELPSAGGLGTYFYTIVGILLTSGTGLIYLYLRKK